MTSMTSHFYARCWREQSLKACLEAILEQVKMELCKMQRVTAAYIYQGRRLYEFQISNSMECQAICDLSRITPKMTVLSSEENS
jgi:hypothetical protein